MYDPHNTGSWKYRKMEETVTRKLQCSTDQAMQNLR